MDRYGIEFLGAVVEVLWDQRSFEHAGTIVYYQSRHYLTGGTRGLRPSYEMMALLPGFSYSVEDRGLPDVQRFKWSSLKPNGHPAEKPVGLMRFCVNTVQGGLVVDPFMGSGTTAIATIESGRKFIGIEIERMYFDLACERIDNAYRQQRLFA